MLRSPALVRALWIALATALLALPGKAATFVSDSYQFDTWVEVGSFCCAHGSGDDRTVTSSVDVFQSDRLASATGTDSVQSSVGLARRYRTLADSGFSVTHQVDLSMRDSEPGSSHSPADGRVSYASRLLVDLTTPPLLPGQTSTFTITFSVDDSDWAAHLDILASASYQVNDLTSGITLASFSHLSPGSVSVDFGTITGHLLEIVFAAQLESSLPAGFGNGATGLSNRTFNYGFDAFTRLEIQSPPIPEPGTAALTLLGLLMLAGRQRRGSGWKRGLP